VKGGDGVPFRYRDKGLMATIGRNAAVAEIGPLRVSGFPAWVIWIVAHIFFLIGLRNRILVMFEWAWMYFTFKRGVRLITSDRATESPARTSHSI